MIIKYFDEYEGSWLDISGETGSVLQYGVSGWTSAPTKKVYNALLTQSGTNPPDVIELENSLGAVTWSYYSSGRYRLTLTDAFKADKYFAPMGVNGNNADTNTGYYANHSIEYYRIDDNIIEVYVASGDDHLSLSPISIIVYV
jgi:hypothetical protein